ncbi:MAG: CvpA family protein [Paludibacteraceae bacterium]|nr:CvpA family protein [Paludibacteraceae bacterium]MBP5136900.1 CvpA family protein [Paludibacteraceae bacterium]MBP5742802.1 CvpA family protein [Paludibacteraceae bacterium]
MNIFDFIIIGLCVFAVIKGLMHGLVEEITSIISVILGVLAARLLAPEVAPKFVVWFSCADYVAMILAYLTIFIVSVMVCLLAGRLIGKTVDKTILSGTNKALGGVVSLVKYLIIASLLINLVHAINAKTHFFGEQYEQESLLYTPVKKIMPALMPFIQEHDFDNLGKAW